MNDVILVHYGVKGMRWGVNKAAKLNRVSKRTDEKSYKSALYSRAVRDAQEGAKKVLKPTQYARYITSGTMANMISRDKQLKKSAARGEAAVSRLLTKYGKDNVLSYDIMTRTYSVQPKESK